MPLQPRGEGDDVELLAGIRRAVESSPSLRNKKDLIGNFVESLSVDGSIEEEWHAYVSEQQERELSQIVSAENLKPEATEKSSLMIPSATAHFEPQEPQLPRCYRQSRASRKTRTTAKRKIA